MPKPAKTDGAALATTLTVRAQLAAQFVPVAVTQFPKDSPKFWAEKAVEYADTLIETLNG